jgi:hypothetical protein
MEISLQPGALPLTVRRAASSNAAAMVVNKTAHTLAQNNRPGSFFTNIFRRLVGPEKSRI